MSKTMTPFRKTNLVGGVDTFMSIMPGVDSVCLRYEQNVLGPQERACRIKEESMVLGHEGFST